MVLNSSMVPGLGVLVVFPISGRSVFKAERVIPDRSIKELSFGIVPNIFDDGLYQARESDANGLKLRFGSATDVANTLGSLGCPPSTKISWQNSHQHIFPGKRLFS
jgi:hypothetical protein